MGYQTGARGGFDIDVLVDIITTATEQMKQKIESIKQNQNNISIADVFDGQMLMNHLSQLSEMTTAIVSAAQSAAKTISQNMRG